MFGKWVARATSPCSAATCRRNSRRAGRAPEQASGLCHPNRVFKQARRNWRKGISARPERCSAVGEGISAVRKPSAAAEEAKLTAEDGRMTAEDAFPTAEDGRMTAEAAFPTAEDGRNPGEDTKFTADIAKNRAEDSFLSAEDAKITGEDSSRTDDDGRPRGDGQRTACPTGERTVGPSLGAASFGILAIPCGRAGKSARWIAEQGRAQRGPTGKGVGCVTPCAPWVGRPRRGGQRTARPTMHPNRRISGSKKLLAAKNRGKGPPWA